MRAVAPGQTIGVLGGGQLARMLVLEARRMGYRTGVLDPDPACPGGQVADFTVIGAWDDIDAARRLAAQSDVVTLDTEHVPASLLVELSALVLVRPGPTVLHRIQNRSAQRRHLASHGIPQTDFFQVVVPGDLEQAALRIGFPAVLKTARAGYDGKGQAKVNSLAELQRAWEVLGRQEAVLERFVAFDCEVSVVLARSASGELAFYPVAENQHRDHVLWRTIVPARIAPHVGAEARAIAAEIATSLEYCGVMAVEFFVTPGGGLLVNELAPRTHNSGHFTLGACATSQFEQHVRAVCGSRLGPTTLLRPAVMLNLLGDAWRHGPPQWMRLLDAHPSAQLHLYGKAQARAGRKMGHILLTPGDDGTDLHLAADSLARALAEPALAVGP